MGRDRSGRLNFKAAVVDIRWFGIGSRGWSEVVGIGGGLRFRGSEVGYTNPLAQGIGLGHVGVVDSGS